MFFFLSQTFTWQQRKGRIFFNSSVALPPASQALKQRERERERQTDRQTDRERETDRQRDRQRERQRERELTSAHIQPIH